MDRDITTTWIDTMLKSLKGKDERLGQRVLEDCGRQCSVENEMVFTAREIGNRYKNASEEEKFEAMKEAFSTDKYKIYKESGMIYAEYDECLCPLVYKKGEIDGLLCECTKGFTKSIVEAVYGRSADVTILKTILRGDDICLLAVRIL
ncbi:MAG: DUF6144 family protein [Eubacteriales bacterium]